MSFTVSKAYLGDDVGFDPARTVLLGGFTDNLLVTFIGHAGAEQWTDEGLLTSRRRGRLASSAKLPIVNALTCWSASIALPGEDSLSERLVMRDGAGAIAVWAPTALEENDLSVRLGTLFAQQPVR